MSLHRYTFAKARNQHKEMIESAIEFVKASKPAYKAHQVEVSKSFYRRLFERAPDLRHLFPQDIEGLAHKFGLMLSIIVDGLDDWNATLDRISKTGRTHRGYGAMAQHYPIVVECLLAALLDELGDVFDAETERGWRSLMTVVSRVMIDAGEYPAWSSPSDTRTNPFAPIMGYTIQQYSEFAFALRDYEPLEVPESELVTIGIDRQTWEALRSGWNARLTDPEFGPTVATPYLTTYRRLSNGVT